MRWSIGVVALVGACDDFGPDYENTIPYPGPCSYRSAGSLGTASATFEYEHEKLIALRIVVNDTSFETSWSWNIDGTIAAIRDGGNGMVFVTWTFEPDRIVKTSSLSGDQTVFDRATFAFYPAYGTRANNPQADLGMVSRNGMAYSWSTEGALLVRTGVDERATFELDTAGRIVMATKDENNDGSIELVDTWWFEDDLPVQRVRDSTVTGYYEVSWRYDKAGNIASEENSISRGEYDYSCW